MRPAGYEEGAIYARVSSDSQTVENQLSELHDMAQRQGWIVVAVHVDEGISGAKSRDQRPGYDALLKGGPQGLHDDRGVVR